MDEASYSERDELMECVTGDAHGVLGKLLRQGADPNTRLGGSGTLLHYAVGQRASSVVLETLLEAGADVEARDEKERTPLQLAYATGTARLAFVLLCHGASGDFVGEGSVKEAFLSVASDDFNAFQDAMASGVPVEARDALGCPLIVRAALSGSTRCVLWLLEQGADIESVWREEGVWKEGLTDTPIPRFSTALSAAAQASQLPCLSALLRAGAALEPDLGEQVNSPLADALFFGWDAVVPLLLAHGADWRAFRQWGIFVEIGAHRHLPLLLAYGLAQDQQILGRIFQDAIHWHHWDITALLRQHGYQLTLWDAVGLRELDTVEALLAAGAPVNEPNAYGATVLSAAVVGSRGQDEAQSLRLIEMLLEAGADPLAQHEATAWTMRPIEPISALEESQRPWVPASIGERLRAFTAQRPDTDLRG